MIENFFCVGEQGPKTHLDLRFLHTSDTRKTQAAPLGLNYFFLVSHSLHLRCYTVGSTQKAPLGLAEIVLLKTIACPISTFKHLSLFYSDSITYVCQEKDVCNTMPLWGA